MGDAVLRVRSRLQNLARENWSDIEKKHVHNVMWLRDELAQISRLLDVKARFEFSGPGSLAPFPVSQEDVFDVAGSSLKKQKTETHEKKSSHAVVNQRKEERPTRRSMRLRSSVNSMENILNTSVKRTRKRSRSSEGMKQDIVTMRVVDLRSELKRRGLRTSGLKQTLCNRLLDAIELEQKEDRAHLPQVIEDEPQSSERQAVVIDDVSDDDEIVRESVESNNSPHSIPPSQQSISSKDEAKEEIEAKISTAVIKDGQNSPLRKEKGKDEDIMKAGSAEDTKDARLVMTSSPETSLKASLKRKESSEWDTVLPDGTSRNSVEPISTLNSPKRARQSVQVIRQNYVTDTVPPDGTSLNTVEPIKTRTSPTRARQSVHVFRQNYLTDQLGWKRKSILRKASSLAPKTQGPVRNVSFAPSDKLDIIFDNSQSESNPSPEKTASDLKPSPGKTLLVSMASPEKTSLDSMPSPVKSSSNSKPSPEKTSSDFKPSPEKTSLDFKQSPKKTSSDFKPGSEKTVLLDRPQTSLKERSDSILDVGTNPKTVRTPVPSSPPSNSPQDHHPIEPDPEAESEEQRKKREFDETVEREAQKLRLAAMLSARKRLEEAKANNALWAQGDELKARLRASSSVGKRQSARTPLSVIDKVPSHQVSPPISESSTAFASTCSTSGPNDRMAISSKVERENDDAKDGDCTRSMARQSSVLITVSSDQAVVNESKAVRATYSIVDDKHHVERSMTDRLAEKPASKSMLATDIVPQSKKPKLSLKIDSQKSDRPIDVSSTKAANNPKPFTLPTTVPAVNREKLESLSSTVSSIPEQSVVENTLKSGTSAAHTGTKRPIANLISGVHSFATLLEKKSTQESSTGRCAPVVNALKLAEKSRMLEEKKRVEKERRKALLKKKLEEHKKIAALKEKNEKDAQAKREQERLNARKKREAELARERQQKLKEMRAGLEKKRAMLAAERKTAQTISTASVLKPTASAPMTLHHKYGGVASALVSSQPPAKLPLKTSQKVEPKLASAPVSKGHQAPKPATKPDFSAVTSPVLAKYAPHSHSPVTYEMSDNVESSDGESDSDATRHGKKKVPRWAQKDHLNKILRVQFGKNAIDPSPAIFQDFVDTCNLEAIFETSDIQKKKKFARRTSSGNWLADRPTARDRALYQRDMGYDRVSPSYQNIRQSVMADNKESTLILLDDKEYVLRVSPCLCIFENYNFAETSLEQTFTLTLKSRSEDEFEGAVFPIVIAPPSTCRFEVAANDMTSSPFEFLLRSSYSRTYTVKFNLPKVSESDYAYDNFQDQIVIHTRLSHLLIRVEAWKNKAPASLTRRDEDEKSLLFPFHLPKIKLPPLKLFTAIERDLSNRFPSHEDSRTFEAARSVSSVTSKEILRTSQSECLSSVLRPRSSEQLTRSLSYSENHATASTGGVDRLFVAVTAVQSLREAREVILKLRSRRSFQNNTKARIGPLSIPMLDSEVSPETVTLTASTKTDLEQFNLLVLAAKKKVTLEAAKAKSELAYYQQLNSESVSSTPSPVKAQNPRKPRIMKRTSTLPILLRPSPPSTKNYLQVSLQELKPSWSARHQSARSIKLKSLSRQDVSTLKVSNNQQQVESFGSLGVF